jgi:hypothetical protein
VGAVGVPLVLAKALLEQGAEDGWADLGPVVRHRQQQELRLTTVELEGGAMPKYGGRRYDYGRPGRRVRGYYRARSRQPGPIPGCLLPLVLAAAIAIHLTRENAHRGPD